MGAEKSDRIVFGIPRHEMIIVGTTDTDYQGDPAQVSVTKEDVRYLLGVVRDYFPGANLEEKDIVSSYAGVRPLVKDGSSSEGKTSREHTIKDDPRGITIVAGGKYTTYRLIAQEVVDHCLQYFSFDERVRFHQPRTELPLNPYVSSEAWHQALTLSHIWSQKTMRPFNECRLLAERYGMEAQEFLFDAENVDLSYIQIEAKIAIQKTMCLHLSDFYTRRVPLFLAERDHGVGTLDEVGEIFARLYGWSPERLRKEQDGYLALIQRELGWMG
jgi:glycerol-3-phosphate dehydrogenase